jgi:ribonuclease E
MASENDQNPNEVDQAPAEKPKRRRVAKKTAAPAPEVGNEQPDAGAVALEQGAPATAAAVEAQVQAGLEPVDEATPEALPPKKKARKSTAKSAAKGAAKKSTRTKATAQEATLPEESAVAGPAVADSADPAAELLAEEPVVAGEPEDEHGAPEAVAPVVPSFGVLFQAPEPVAPRRRRATAPVQAPTERPAADDAAIAVETAGTGAEAPESARRGEDDRADDLDRRADDTGEQPGEGGGPERSADEAEGGSRSRRRRGGRGRRGRSQGDDESAATASEPSDAEAEESTDTGPQESDDAESGSSRRRRRRRRGASGEGEGEDPPGTVTKVREPRSSREEPTAVKGSTRLEAKKQRRREGREAGRRRTIITEAEFLARRESVERVMVVRGRGDRTQIGVLEDGVLVEHYVSRETTASMAGNVYLGRVQNVLPSMEAAFVDIGKGRNAVLYAGEVNWDAAGIEGGQGRRIENALSSGDTVLVQVTKDPIGHKGARLTSQISLPGRYLVYVPEGQMTGISRKLPDTERARLKAILKEVVPDSAGVIVRTAAEGASEEELRADVQRLTAAWEKISAKADAARAKKTGSGGAPVLLHGEPDLTVRVIRDVFTEDFTSLVVSGDKAWSEISGYVEDVAPDLAPRLQRWTAEEDVFAAHRIDEALAKAMDRKVWLPSGGSLVIDRTEAMTVVDVNTGKFVGSGGNLEETVTKNNLEAAEEIVRQLRLRDIGGIIVVDFIDMVLESNRDLVVRRLLECLGRDRTKHQVAEVTSLGLVQMTRKRVGSGLIEVFSEPCEHCNGRGIVVHAEPVDRGGSGDQGGQGGGPAGSRSSRGRRGAAGAGGTNAGSASGQGGGEEPRTPSGPTAAQIAAAAHAAALRKAEAGADAGVDVPDVGATVPGAEQPLLDVETAEVSSPDAPAREEVAEGEGPDGVEVSSPPVVSDAAVVLDGGAVPAVAEPAEAEEPAVAAPAVAEPVAAEPVAPRARRKRGRVVAPAGPPRVVSSDAPDAPSEHQSS